MAMSTSKALLEATPDVWENVLQRYSDALNAKASKKTKPGASKQLQDLDKWYQKELPDLIQNRREHHIKHDELAKLMTWKLSRGKFRPRLEEMVKSNTEEAVESCSKKAFKALPNLEAAIKALTPLKAVGPATASAVLAAGAPQHAPFMADESMLALPGLQPLDYTLNHYLAYASKVKDICDRLNGMCEEGGPKSWTPHQVELTLWTYYTAKQLQPSILAGIDITSKNGGKTEIKRAASDKDIDDKREHSKRFKKSKT